MDLAADRLKALCGRLDLLDLIRWSNDYETPRLCVEQNAYISLPSENLLKCFHSPSALSRLKVRVGRELGMWETSGNTEVSHAQEVYYAAVGEGTPDVA